MEAEDVVMQGQQLLYTNQFDELTYNADKIVQMTSQLNEVLKRFSYSFSNKNLTSFLYWFVTDALYFPPTAHYEVERINHIRSKKHSHRPLSAICPDPADQYKFITKMRLLSMTFLKTNQFKQILQIPTDTLIQLFEKQHQTITSKNDEILNKFSNRVLSEKDKFYKKLKELQIDPKQGSPLLVYYNFQKKMIRDWMEQVELKKQGVKCEICSRRDRLTKCKKCNLSVHPYCYPKLPKNYQEKQFLCENCQKHLNDKTQCIFCPIRGGHFLEVEYPSKRPTFTITKSEGLKLKIKKNILEQEKHYIHLSCSLWHPEIQYNIKKGKIDNIHRIDRKKTQNSCYECGTNIGVTIPCANENCRRFYHPECAKKIHLSTCIINAKNKLLIELYCDRHRRPFIHQILKQNILNNLKEIKKLYEGVDHEIKRMLSASYLSDRKIQTKNSDEPERYDCCLYCKIPHQENLSLPITNCCKCYNWYHKHCSSKCLFCDVTPVQQPEKKS